MIQFYSSDISQGKAQLEEDEFHHCCKVLRHKVGDEIPITNGKGTTAKAIITLINKRTADLDVLSKSQAANKLTSSTLAIAPPKNRARWEWLIEKAVEIGVDQIIPLKTTRTERAKINIERSEKIMRSAALQSLRAHHPDLTSLVSFEQFMQNLPEKFDRYIAHFQPDNHKLQAVQKQQSSAFIIIGPEGDFTEDELQHSKEQNIVEVNISAHRLRTETAAIVGVTLLKSLGY